MEIQRINEYADERFDPEILRQHGAFLVDGCPCSFRILDGHSARVYYHDYPDMEKLSHEEYEVKWNQFCDDFFDREGEEES